MPLTKVCDSYAAPCTAAPASGVFVSTALTAMDILLSAQFLCVTVREAVLTASRLTRLMILGVADFSDI